MPNKKYGEKLMVHKFQLSVNGTHTRIFLSSAALRAKESECKNPLSLNSKRGFTTLLYFSITHIPLLTYRADFNRLCLV